MWGKEIYGDDLLQRRVKTLYICKTKGCGLIFEGKAEHCKDCRNSAVREEIEAEYEKRN